MLAQVLGLAGDWETELPPGPNLQRLGFVAAPAVEVRFKYVGLPKPEKWGCSLPGTNPKSWSNIKMF